MINLFKSLLYNLYQLFVFSGKRVKRYFKQPEKSYFRRVLDQIYWLYFDRKINLNYYAFGLNIKNKSNREYIGKREFLLLKTNVENLMREKQSNVSILYDVLTKDKFINFAYLKFLNVPVVPVKKIIYNQMLDFSGEISPLSDLFLIKEDFIIKNTTMEYGEGFLYCSPSDENHIIVNGKSCTVNDLTMLLGKKIWIIQDVIQAHAVIRSINDSALNTTRIVTIMNGLEPVYLTGFQSFATGNQKIDNWGKGAVYVGIDPEKNKLKAFGYFHPANFSGTITMTHPDSGIRFSDYTIPFLDEAVKICLYAHKFFFNHFVIGWDVIITDNGPMILEANEKPGMNAVQCLDGGLRKKIKDYYVNTMKYLNS